VRIGYDAEAESSQFPISENGIVIIGAPVPVRLGAFPASRQHGENKLLDDARTSQEK
jgi:hypothetical protein